MGERRVNVNREKNGCRRSEELERALCELDDDADDGLATGLGARDRNPKAVFDACLEHAKEKGTEAAIEDAGYALGSHLTALQVAGGAITDRDIADAATRFAVEVSDAINLDDGQDAYDIAHASVHEGSERPRLGLAAKADQQKQGGACAAKGRGADDDEYYARQAASLTEAIKKADAGDAGALFEGQPLAWATELQKHAPDKYQRHRAEIKKLGADVLKQWERALRQQKANEREEAKRNDLEMKLHSAAKSAKGGRAAETANEEEAANEPLDTRSAFEYGTSSSFDPLNEFMGAEILRLLNRQYAVVTVGGETRVLEVTEDDKIVLHRPDALRQKFENIRVPMTGKAQPVNILEVWMKWPRRSTYEGLGFYPGSPKHPPEVPRGHFNMWRGPAIDPKKGPWPLLYDHLLSVVCAGDEGLLQWLLDWIAQLLQEPQRKPGTSVVLRSRTEGTGKSLVGYVLRKILGHAALSASRADAVAGRFNSHLQSVLLLIAEEALYAGHKAASGILKDLATCDEMSYEAKGLPIITAPNYTRVLFISNEDWIVPAGPTSRRYAVFDCENRFANDRSYFDPLFEEIDKGGAEAFLYDMQKRKIKSDLRTPPITRGLLEQREMSLDGFGKWLLGVAQSGQVRISDKDGDRTIELTVAVDLGAEIAFEDLRKSVEPYLDPYERRSIDHRLGKLLKAVGATKDRLPKSVDRSRPWGYAFPPLKEFRTAVALHTGVVAEPDADERTHDREPSSGAAILRYDTGKRAAKSLRAATLH
jgi:Family of unknown function (DUF5906)